MTPSQNFYAALQQFEGLKLSAYKDSAGIPTIGIGTIRYPDGTPVKMGDTCTMQQAIDYAAYEANKKAKGLALALSPVVPTQGQFDALLLLVYNIGLPAFAASTLCRYIKAGTGDIKAAWMMWNKARVKGVLTVVPGLTARRAKEYAMYAKG